MNEFKQILTFISYSFRRFFVNLAVHLGYLFVTVTVTLPVFFISYKSFKNHTFFLVYLVLLTTLNYMFRRSMVFRHQLKLNVRFVRFLGNPDAFFQDDTNKKEPVIEKETIKKVQAQLKGSLFLPGKLLAAYTALYVEKEMDFSKKKANNLGLYIKYMLIQLALFVVLLLPFVGISSLFTMGAAPAVTMLVYLMGLFFVYFLNASILDPILSLKLLEQIYIGIQDR